MTPEVEFALTSIAIFSTTSAALGYLWTKFTNTFEMTDHNISVEILRDTNKNNQDRFLTEYDLQYPVYEVLKGDLVTRGNWMAVRDEKWRYTVEEEDEFGITAIKLESWLVTRHQHQFLHEYGRVHQATVDWDSWNIYLNLVVIHPLIPVEDMPNVLEVGPSAGNWVVGNMAYVVSQKAFMAFRSHPIETGKGREVTVGKRLLFHCVVDRDEQPADFDVEAFSGWDFGMVHDLMGDRKPGSQFNNFSLEEAGLSEREMRRAQENEGELKSMGRGEQLLQEEEEEEKEEGDEEKELDEELEKEEKEIAEGDEISLKFTFKPTSPPHPGSVGKVYNDMDNMRRRRKRKYKRTPGMRTKMVRDKKRKVETTSPINLTKEHEKEILRHMVMSVDPQAKAYWTKFHNEVAMTRMAGIVPEVKEGPYEYGSGPGGWSLTDAEKEEDMRMISRSPHSSVLSPLGELSQNISSSFGGTPCPKKPRKNTGTDSDVSVALSPFLSMKRPDDQVINISSDDDGLRKVRVNLGELLGAGRIKWPEDGMLATIQVEMDEEEIMPDVDTESGDDDQAIVLN